MKNKIPSGLLVYYLMLEPLPFKLPIICQSYVDVYPTVFELGIGEYGASIDEWLRHQVLSYTSEQNRLLLFLMAYGKICLVLLL